MKNNNQQVRASVAKWVARCVHVASSGSADESFRKAEWKRAKHDGRLQREMQQEIAKVVVQPTATLIQETLDILPDDASTEQATVAHVEEHPEQEEGRTVLEEQSAAIHAKVTVRRVDTGSASSYLPIQRPCLREGSSVTLCSSTAGALLVVFGGRFQMDMYLFRYSAEYHPGRVQTVFSNDTFCFSLVEKKWLFVRSTGSLPPGRCDHVAVFVQPDLLVVSGGRGRNGQVFDDVFVLQLGQWQWSKIQQSHNGKLEPIRERYWHAACLNAQGIFVFGGRSDTCMYGDTIIYESSFDRCLPNRKEPRPIAWTYAITVGRPPTPRCGMSVVALDPDRIAVVGGWAMTSTWDASDELDVFILDTVTCVWTSPRLSSFIKSVRPPRARLLFQCFLVHDVLCVFGGYHLPDPNAESQAPVGDNQLYQLHLKPRIWSSCPLHVRVLSHSVSDTTVATSYITLAVSTTEPSLLEPIEISFLA